MRSLYSEVFRHTLCSPQWGDDFWAGVSLEGDCKAMWEQLSQAPLWRDGDRFQQMWSVVAKAIGNTGVAVDENPVTMGDVVHNHVLFMGTGPDR